MLNSPEQLDALWREFLESGDLAPVRKIAEVLAYQDLTRAGLAQWRAKKPLPWGKKRKARILARLAELGLSPDNAVDQDLVLWKLMAGGFQVRQELPFPLSDDHVRHMMVKGAACWSLQSNAQQHPAVGEFVAGLDAMKSAPDFLQPGSMPRPQ